MTGRTITERILDAYLAPAADRLPDRVIDAALADIDRTPQRRALRVPRRFPYMPALTRATGIAAAALVVVVGAGSLIYLNTRAPGGGGGTPTPTVTPAPAPTTPGITGFTSYTSAAHRFTLGYPDGWRLYVAAERKWQPGDQADDPYQDIFTNPKDRDGDDIALSVWQQAAGSGADVSSRQGLTAWAAANWCGRAGDPCTVAVASDVALPMCLGRAACRPAVLLPLAENIGAFFADPETGLVTVVMLLRHDTFPAAARYGGGVQLLKSILTTMDVWTPEPGQIPSQ